MAKKIVIAPSGELIKLREMGMMLLNLQADKATDPEQAELLRLQAKAMQKMTDAFFHDAILQIGKLMEKVAKGEISKDDLLLSATQETKN